MTALSVSQPYSIFTDIDGNPLEAGYIYIGTAGLDAQVYSISAYWDVNLSIPASQPIRTFGGYPVRSGSPGRLYVNSDYSIKVLNKNGTIVYSALNATDRFSSVITTTSSDSVTYTPLGGGAVSTNAQVKFRQELSVFDFMIAAEIADVLAGSVSVDVSAAVNAAFASVAPFGGVLVFPKGKYLFSSQVTVDRTTAVITGGYNGERNLKVVGEGAEIRTSGAISAFKIKGNWTPNNLFFSGFTIFHRGNAQATNAFEISGSNHTKLENITVVVSGSLPANYSAFLFTQKDVSDADTGSFWCSLDGCNVRPWAGTDGYCDFGARTQGSINALIIKDCVFSGSNTHVSIEPSTSTTTGANAVVLDRCAFEAPTTSTAIKVTSAHATYHTSGLRITNCRGENIDTFLDLAGTGSTVQIPVYKSGNYLASSVTTSLKNTLSIPINNYDAVIVGADVNPITTHNIKGLVLKNTNASYDTVTLWSPNVGSGFTLANNTGVAKGQMKLRAVEGVKLGGASAFSHAYLSWIGGVSGTGTECNNFSGSKTFGGGASTSVTFATAETDANYKLIGSCNANETIYFNGKLTTGFIINSSNGSSTATVDYLVFR